MDLRHSTQDALLCDLCETLVTSMYCDICHIKLCIPCVGVHLSNRSTKHEVVSFEERGSTTICPKHSTKICELHCEQCNIPICSLCVSSREHKSHQIVDISKSLTTKKEAIKRNFEKDTFGSLTKLAISTTKHGSQTKLSGDLFPLARTLIAEPRILTEIKTEHDIGFSPLSNVCCLNDNELWTSGYCDIFLRLYNIQGDLLKTVKAEKLPFDIAVTQNQNLVYTDYKDRSINIVKNTQIMPLIRLREWRPLRLCSTYSGDLLVTMVLIDWRQSKVVRYSGSTVKQSIQWDDQGKALYSSSTFGKYLSENKNFDICVADVCAGAVVVVSAAGKLRFRYTGPIFPKMLPFKPHGITTDSQSRVLAIDYHNSCIHILDQDGKFLRFIDNCRLQEPCGLSIDSRDNLFVAEMRTCKVKKIQYSE